MNVLRDEAGDLGRRISNDIEQSDNVRASSEILQYLYFALDLFLLDWLEHFYDALFIMDDIDAFEDLGP